MPRDYWNNVLERTREKREAKAVKQEFMVLQAKPMSGKAKRSRMPKDWREAERREMRGYKVSGLDGKFNLGQS